MSSLSLSSQLLPGYRENSPPRDAICPFSLNKQLRKGAWLQRSFTLSTPQPSVFLPSPSYFILHPSYLKLARCPHSLAATSQLYLLCRSSHSLHSYFPRASAGPPSRVRHRAQSARFPL